MKSFKQFTSEAVGDKPAYHYYATNRIGVHSDPIKVNHSKKKPFTSMKDAAAHLKRNHKGSGTVHKVVSTSGKIVDQQTMHDHQWGYPTKPKDINHVDHLKEGVQLDEISDEKKAAYVKAAVADRHKRWFKPASDDKLTPKTKRLTAAWKKSKEFKKANNQIDKRSHYINKLTGQEDGGKYKSRHFGKDKE